MPELRWTLLVVGVLFIVALAWWELSRKRQARGQGLGQTSPSQEGDHTAPVSGAAGESPHPHREPTLTLPELHAEPRFQSRAEPRGREPTQNPPVVEINQESFDHLERSAGEPRAARVKQEVPLREFERTEPTISDSLDDDTEQAGFGSPSMAGRPGPAAATVFGDGRTRHTEAAASEDEPAEPFADELTDEQRDEWTGQRAEGNTPMRDFAVARDAGEGAAHEPGSGSNGTVFERAEDDEEAPASSGAPAPLPGAGAVAAGAPVVDWPTEQSRKIVALRLVSGSAERFPGRAVRLALASEGFVLGKFDIFHKPGPDSRAVLSAASLTKPGTFALNTMDAQRFGGLSLFAVLPGPLPAQETFDELLATARNLNDRLQGALQDERGEPLTPMRGASIRESLGAADAAHAARAGASDAAGDSGTLQ